MDPTMYFENRLKAIATAKAAGFNPYPHKFDVTMQLHDYITKFSGLETGSHITEETISLAGEAPVSRYAGRPKDMQPNRLKYVKCPRGAAPQPLAFRIPRDRCALRYARDVVRTSGMLALVPMLLSPISQKPAGRIQTKRASGTKLIFYDLKSEGNRVQVMVDARCASHGSHHASMMFVMSETARGICSQD